MRGATPPGLTGRYSLVAGRNAVHSVCCVESPVLLYRFLVDTPFEVMLSKPDVRGITISGCVRSADRVKLSPMGPGRRTRILVSIGLMFCPL